MSLYNQYILQHEPKLLNPPNLYANNDAIDNPFLQPAKHNSYCEKPLRIPKKDDVLVLVQDFLKEEPKSFFNVKGYEWLREDVLREEEKWRNRKAYQEVENSIETANEADYYSRLALESNRNEINRKVLQFEDRLRSIPNINEEAKQFLRNEFYRQLFNSDLIQQQSGEIDNRTGEQLPSQDTLMRDIALAMGGEAGAGAVADNVDDTVKQDEEEPRNRGGRGNRADRDPPRRRGRPATRSQTIRDILRTGEENP